MKLRTRAVFEALRASSGRLAAPGVGPADDELGLPAAAAARAGCCGDAAAPPSRQTLLAGGAPSAADLRFRTDSRAPTGGAAEPFAGATGCAGAPAR